MHYEGNCWLVADRVQDIKKGKFHIVGQRIPCDNDGKIPAYACCRLLNHDRLFDGLPHKEVIKNDKDYYPKCSVTIYNDHAFIKLSRTLNNMDVISALVRIFNLEGLFIVRDVDMDYDHYLLR